VGARNHLPGNKGAGARAGDARVVGGTRFEIVAGAILGLGRVRADTENADASVVARAERDARNVEARVSAAAETVGTDVVDGAGIAVVTRGVVGLVGRGADAARACAGETALVKGRAGNVEAKINTDTNAGKALVVTRVSEAVVTAGAVG
jgi:hypothetical protein